MQAGESSRRLSLSEFLAAVHSDGEEVEDCAVALSLLLLLRLQEGSGSSGLSVRWGDIRTGRAALDNEILRTALEWPLGSNSGALTRLCEQLANLSHSTVLSLVRWVDATPLETPRERLRLARSFDDVEAITRSFVRARIGQGPGSMQVAELMIELAAIHPGDSVLDPCFGTGGLLAACLQRQYSGVSFTGFESDPGHFLIGLVRALLCGAHASTVRLVDPLGLPLHASAPMEAFDCMLLAPRWGNKIPDVQRRNFPLKTTSTENGFLQFAMSALRLEGRAVAILNDGILYRDGADAELRRQLLRGWVVEAIVSLPRDIFLPETHAKASVLVFRRSAPQHSTRFLQFPGSGTSPSVSGSAAGLVESLRRGELDEEVYWEVHPSELEQRGAILLAERTRKPMDKDPQILTEISAIDRGPPISRLADVATIISGITPRDKHKVKEPRPPAGALGVLRILDISQGGLQNPGIYLQPEYAKTVRGDKRLDIGDILVSMKSSIGKVVEVSEPRSDLAPGDSLIILRPNRDRLLPPFLRVMLQSDTYQVWLKGQATGSTGQTRVKAEIFQEMLIPAPDLAVQNQVVQMVLREGMDAGQALLQVLNAQSFLPEEVAEPSLYIEGAIRRVAVNAYERDPESRRKCIAAHGTDCCVCGFSFGTVYGEVAEGYIHVHHLRPLSEVAEAHAVDPIVDLRPVCPNCHAVLHRREPAFSIEEVRAFLSNRNAGGAC